MGGKSGGDAKMPVTLYYASVHFGICHGPVDSINRMHFNEKVGWRSSDPPSQPNTVPPFWQVNKFTDTHVSAWSIPDIDMSNGVGGFQNQDLVLWELEYRADWAKALEGGHLVWQDYVPPTPNPATLGPLKKRKIVSVSLESVNVGTWYDSDYENYMLIRLSTDSQSVGLPRERELFRPFTGSVGLHVYAKDVKIPGDPEDEEPPLPSSQKTVYINAPGLFGGLKKEGGVQGHCHLMIGDDVQVVPRELAAKLGRTPQNMPAYRGVANAWFYDTGKGFYWSCNSNRLPDVWINVTSIPRGFAPQYAKIGDDANPAHIIFEAMTNTDWGMGAPLTSFDMVAWTAAAKTLYDENFGLSMMWVEQMEIEKFVSEVIDHIEGSLYVHPRTGLFVLKLIRDDYDESQLRILTPDNALLSEFQRKAWGETVNEITVTYRNPENEEEMSFSIQDTANIGMQGDIITDNRNYYGIRNAALAARVAERDLRSAAAPLCSCTAQINRSAWDLVPGEVVKVTWPEYGLNELIMRVGTVDYGRPGEPRVRATLIEDIFFMPSDSYFVPPTSEWMDPREAAVPIGDVRIVTAPYYSVMKALSITDEASTFQPQYPEVLAGVLGSTYQRDAQDFNLQTPVRDSIGNESYGSIGYRELVGYATTAAPLTREASSHVKFIANTPSGAPSVGGFVLIGDGSDRETELAVFESFDTELGWKLRRGVLDTAPKDWPENTPVRFFDENSNFVDTTVRSDFSSVSYKLLTRTSLNELSPDEAPVVLGTLNGRPHYPFRPANVRLNNVLWGPGKIDHSAFNISWSIRSRLQETTVISSWTEGPTIPESGQTTNVTIYDHNGVKIAEQTGLTTASASFASLFALIPGPSIKYRVESERDGLKSLQAVEHTVEVAGYGMNYGNHYGGLS